MIISKKETIMYLKKVLNQPNLVGTMLIALMVCSGFVYAFAFDGFNVQTATQGDVETWIANASGGASSGNDDIDDNCAGKCTAEGKKVNNCQGSNCTFKCKNKPTPHSLPRTGAEPNSTQEMRKRCSGDLHRIRTYDEDGIVIQDEDHDAPHGDHGIPHIHLWVKDEDGIPQRNDEPED